MDTHTLINTIHKKYKLSVEIAAAIVYAVQDAQGERKLVTEDMPDKKLTEQKADIKDSLTMRMITICGIFSALIVAAMSLVMTSLL